jgi:hypothetical protein
MLARLGLATVNIGGVGLRQLPGVGAVVVARWDPDDLQLMPHGGVAQVAELSRLLAAAGAKAWEAKPQPADTTRAMRERLEAALERVRSPRGVELLLDQPRRWAAEWPNDPELDRVLNRLMEPPLVAIVGPPNVGKSTLVNALSGTSTSIVADQPGTTRDHVGVSVEVDGLAIRLIDCPGIRETDDSPEGVIERRAIAASLTVAARADMVVIAIDPNTLEFAPPSEIANPPTRLMRVGLRSDLVDQTRRAAWDARFGAAVSVHQGTGLRELAIVIRRWLLPDAALNSHTAWRFWEATATEV